MLLRLLLLLTIVPLVELVILLRLADRFSWGTTIALVVLTGVLGAWLARREGIRTLGRIQADLNAGKVPTDALVEGALILVAGLVLVTPGVLTDLVGFALLIGPIRRWVRRRMAEAFKRRIVVAHHGPAGWEATPSDGPDEFIDVVAASKDADSLEDEAAPVKHDEIA